MREDNHEKRMFYKFIFLLVVTGLIIIVCIWKWTGDDTKEQNPEEMFQTSGQQEHMQEPVGLDEDKINAALKDEGEDQKTDKTDDSKQSQHMENIQEEVDLEQNIHQSIWQTRGGASERASRKSASSIFIASNGLG